MLRTPFVLTCAAAIVLALSPAAAQSPLSPADSDAIRRSVAVLIERTNNDPMGTLSEYVQSPHVTSVNSEAIVTGYDALVAQTRTQRAGAFTMASGELDISGMGADHALVVAPFTMYYRINGSTVTVPGSMTLAYERTSDGWKILHEHYSEGLDEQTRRRLAGAARGGVTGADLLRLAILGLGGTSAQMVGALSSMLASQGCTAR
jgi:ketosteroid isomerase-like protein